MFATLRRTLKLKWGRTESGDSQDNKSLLLQIFLGILEDIIFWKRTWVSIIFIILLNILFFVGSYGDTKPLVFVFYILIFTTCCNALESWLKYKHRTTSLKHLASRQNNQLDKAMKQFVMFMKNKWMNYVSIRSTNHTKAFLMVNILLTVIYIIGTYIGGYLSLYLLSIMTTTFHVIAPIIIRTVKIIPYSTDSDCELEGLIPDATEQELQELTFESEQPIDEKQILENWKPTDNLPNDDESDSSANSSSTTTTLSLEKIKTIGRDINTSDSSDEEYIPSVQSTKENLQSTMEVTQTPESWSSTAFSAIKNITGAVTNVVYPTNENKRESLTRTDSSDGFEIIDKTDLL